MRGGAPEATDAALRFARAASIDIGGANASSVLGFDPIARFADYIVRAAAGHAKMK